MAGILNTFEANHGHLHDIITRQNSPWQSLTILVESIADKTIGFDAELAPDCRASLKWSKWCSQLVPPDRMTEDCAFFGTSRDSCSCAETVHLSSSLAWICPVTIDIHWGPTSQTFPMGWGSSCKQVSKRWTIPRLFMIELAKR
jgi:hypothetical protein